MKYGLFGSIHLQVRSTVDLHPGDAMLYLGMDGEHGRDVFKGETVRKYSYIMFWLHGPCFKYYFDRIIDTEDLVKTTTTISGENKLECVVMTTSSHQMREMILTSIGL